MRPPLETDGQEKIGDIAVAGKVARATDTVHHARTKHMRRVHRTEDIGLKRSVHRNDTKTADNLRIVRYLRRTDNKLVVEKIHIGEHFTHHVIADSKRTRRRKTALALLDEVDHRSCTTSVYISNVGMSLARPRSLKRSIRHIAHARLQRQEVLGQTACMQLAQKEVDHIRTYLLRHLIRLCERLHTVKGIAAHHTCHLARVYP